jgi:hypothetical protein
MAQRALVPSDIPDPITASTSGNAATATSPAGSPTQCAGYAHGVGDGFAAQCDPASSDIDIVFTGDQNPATITPPDSGQYAIGVYLGAAWCRDHSLGDCWPAGTAQIQSDWNEANNLLLDYIKNKPDLAAKENSANKNVANGYAPLDGNALLPPANAPTGALGKVLIGQGPGVAGAYADPLVQGTQVDGSATEPSPVLGGLWDGSHLRAPLGDSSGRQYVNVADGSNVTLGAKADAASTATDTTAVTVMQVLKEISAKAQSPAATPVTSTPLTDLDSSIQAPGSATPSKAVQVGGTDGTNTIVPYIDPCQRGAKTFIAISLTATTKLVSGVSAKKIYVCSINLIAAAATNVALVEGTKVTTECDTSTAGIKGLSGGATAATGWNFAANGGIAFGSGGFSVGAEATNADDLCVLVSAANQISGGLSYVVY